MVTQAEVLKFWFEELTAKQWFVKDENLDIEIKRRFDGVLQRARSCELFQWRSTPEGRLAEIIVLDQFSRNIHRGSAASFAGDDLALALAQEAVRQGDDRKLDVVKRAFVYLPYMHSESLAIHKVAVELFNQPGLEMNYDFEIQHKKIIEQFGRYPHRNKILGRLSTAAEIEFLKGPGSSF